MREGAGGAWCSLSLCALGLLACTTTNSERPAPATTDARDGLADGVLVVPERLQVVALPGGNGVLEVITLTLRREGDGHALYAAVKNVGDVPACSAALSVELFDRQERSLAAAIGGLLSEHFYRLTDGTDAIAACVGPGDVSMAALSDLPPDLMPEDVSTVVYRCPYFALDVVPLAGLDVQALTRTMGTDGTTFSGTLDNRLDTDVARPSVTVFAIDHAGRPLAVTRVGRDAPIPPGGHWRFTTAAVREAGVDQRAFPAGRL